MKRSHRSVALILALLAIGTLIAALADIGPFASGQGGQDNSIHIENLDSPTVDVRMDGKPTGLLECGAMEVILSRWRWGPPPWEFEVINTWTGATMATFSLDEPLPQAIRIRNGEVLHGPWPGGFGPVPPPTCSPDR